MNKKFLFSGLMFFVFGIVILFLSLPKNQPQVLPTSTQSPTSTARLNIYPNPVLTPGDVFDVTEAQICVKGYSSSVRDVSLATKKLVYQEYGVTYPATTGAYEVDHFIPLELGGSNDIKNLWLEPADPKPGFHEKDKVENFLHDEVCSGTLDLKKAQQQIINDWYTVYQSIPN